MKIIATLILVLAPSLLMACEVCGCSAAGGGIGTIGASRSHLLGFSFQGRYFNSAHPALFSSAIERSNERFYTVALTGKIQLSKRWQLLAQLPLDYNIQSKEGIQTIHSGFGDLSVHGRFAPVYRADSLTARAFIVQTGVGVKAPTGRFSSEAHETTNLFPGTGSWDIPIDLNAYLVRASWTLQFENTLNLKTSNRSGYQYGHSVQSTLYGQWNWKKSNIRLSPGAGFQLEYLQADRISGSSESTYNGGTLLNVTPGLNLEWKRFFLIGRYLLPIAQDLSRGYTTSQGQFSCSLFYIF